MRKNHLAYWWCQFGGWTFYGLSMFFFIWVYYFDVSTLYLKRTLLSIFFGLLFTHLLRFIILKLKLTAPIFGKQWIHLFALILFICIAYSYAISTVVEWLKLYDPKMKASVPERFFFESCNRFTNYSCLAFYLLFMALH